MDTTLLDAVRRFADDHADAGGVARTPIPGLVAIRQAGRTELSYQIQRPLACLVLQGSKHVAIGAQSFTFGAGDSLLVMADVPTSSQVTRASAAAPYYSLVLDLDPAVIAGLATEMATLEEADDRPVRGEATDNHVRDAALRLMRLVERPASIPVLQDALVREFHYWLLLGRHGAAIRRLGLPDSHVRRVARAVAVLRRDYARRLPVEELAALAGMSPSSFHHHFRAVTSLTPRQFQKQLRLIEARRLMLAEGASASHAAHTVGYESVQQFTREYGRMFGLPPMRAVNAAQGRLQTA
ncbi:AraC family transcriptional regulator N-terminal domain-containing protein [Massilia oculi]|uniref:AraC family transcriptional regulator n=1 Tax=Massilia oculi TaxID=945844 RepID=A0A2S2DIB2_9BURK|nr:AraC family transcriptional regulator [Massilia oculi]AWL05064.1 AraC family transcriptional regulator [Massilia oculi]